MGPTKLGRGASAGRDCASWHPRTSFFAILSGARVDYFFYSPDNAVTGIVRDRNIFIRELVTSDVVGYVTNLM